MNVFYGLLFFTAVSSAIELPDKVDFNKHIQPILSDRCYKCHGPDGGDSGKNWKGALRLDIEDGAKADLSELKFKLKNVKRAKAGKPLSTKKAEPKFAIVAGDLSKSTVIERIFTDDEDDIMPPSDSNLHLSKYEKALIKKWISQGAQWGKHWSYIVPVKAPLPKVSAKNWPKNEVDYFILNALDSKSWTPSSETDRSSWLRRVYLDLAGIPPLENEVNAFLKDTTPQAYEKVVDQLLNSTHYAERMALEWLDNARFADTSGYQYDPLRSMWPWRDWVIKAFAKNMPYDRFVTEQLAGDMLPNATFDQKVATGFNRNHGYTIEGGVIEEEYRIQYVNDRVTTVGTLFLGMTMDCTRCHDHKYDALTAKDFYSLSAFFDKIQERGRGGLSLSIPPVVNLKCYDIKRVESLEKQLLGMKKATLTKSEQQEFTSWEQRISSSKIVTQTFEKVNSRGGATVEALKDSSFRFTGKLPEKDLYTFTGEVNSQEVKSLLLEVLPDSSMPNNGPGREAKGNGILSAIDIFVGKGKSLKKLVLKDVVADHSQRGYPISNLLKKGGRGWAIEGHKKHDRRLAAFELKSPLKKEQKITLTIKLHFNSSKHSFGRIRFSTSSISAKETLKHRQLKKVLGTGESKKQFIKDYSARGKKITILQKQIANEKKNVVPIMVMQEKPGIRQTYILERGEYNLKGAKVSATTPEVLADFSKYPKNRIGLAQWLVAKENPLMARVTVNRIWQMVFGIGLVKTTEDFGVQGDKASHPELLDWLAVDFRENGWDMHKLLKKMVLSATYRQSSKVSNQDNDPDNRFLSHGPRFRLQAEFIRDQALHLAGHLNQDVGGPSVYPYQPEGLWKGLSNRPNYGMIYKQAHGDSLYRKSLYTVWKRAYPNPTMTTFDAPGRDVCSVKRARTNTPLQALALLHGPVFVEASRIMADRALRTRGGLDNSQLIAKLFKKVLIRQANSAEIEILLKVFEKKKVIFSKNDKLLKTQLSVGDYKHQLGLNQVELASLTTVCQILLNLSETITRN